MLEIKKKHLGGGVVGVTLNGANSYDSHITNPVAKEGDWVDVVKPLTLSRNFRDKDYYVKVGGPSIYKDVECTKPLRGSTYCKFLWTLFCGYNNLIYNATFERTRYFEKEIDAYGVWISIKAKEKGSFMLKSTELEYVETGGYTKECLRLSPQTENGKSFNDIVEHYRLAREYITNSWRGVYKLNLIDRQNPQVLVAPSNKDLKLIENYDIKIKNDLPTGVALLGDGFALVKIFPDLRLKLQAVYLETNGIGIYKWGDNRYKGLKSAIEAVKLVDKRAKSFVSILKSEL